MQSVETLVSIEMRGGKGNWWHGNWFFVLGAGFSVVFSTAFCLVLDVYSEEVVLAKPQTYFAFFLAGAVPLAYALWHLRKSTLWFGFGMWLGTMALLPWIPWHPCKRFFAAVHKIETGQTLSEVRAIMREFSEEETDAPLEFERIYLYDGPEPLWRLNRSLDVPTLLRPITADNLLRYGDGTLAFPETETRVFNYAWDRYGVSDLDKVTVTLKYGVVSRVQISRE